jgi:hypothetical protein
MADRTSPPSQLPSSVYSRTFTALAVGAFLFVTGSIGWDVSYLHGLFAGGRWVHGPVWWQIGLGAGLLVLGGRWFRRLI